MAFLGNDVLDAALNEIATGTVIHITSSEPTNYAAVSGVSLGTATPAFGSPADGDVSGRKIQVNAVSAGTVSGTGTAAYFAIVDASALLATGALSSSQGVTSGNTWTLTAFDIEIPDPA